MNGAFWVGLTGGAGAGKSSLAVRLAALGAGVVDADELARRALDEDEEVAEEVVRTLGSAVTAPGGGVDRSRVADLIFADPRRRAWLEGLIHPRVIAEWRRRCAEAPGDALLVMDVPLLFETGLERDFDRTVAVGCPRPEQEERLRRRGWSPDRIRGVLEAQWTCERKMERADYVVFNGYTPAWLDAQARAVWERLRRDRDARRAGGAPAASAGVGEGQGR